MERKYFARGMEKLQDHFGRTLKTVQLESWWEVLRVWDAEQFWTACLSLAKKSKTFPSITDLEEERRSRLLHPSSSPKTQVRCPRCDGLGWIPFCRISPVSKFPQIVSARCGCQNGDRHSSVFARFDDLFPDTPGVQSFAEAVMVASKMELRAIDRLHAVS